jgi:hypothetical protein
MVGCLGRQSSVAIIITKGHYLALSERMSRLTCKDIFVISRRATDGSCLPSSTQHPWQQTLVNVSPDAYCCLGGEGPGWLWHVIYG